MTIENEQARNAQDPMEEWSPVMERIMGKEQLDSLTYWQKTIEVAPLREHLQHNSIFKSIFGFDFL